MRLWTLHPRYLDTKGLVALWREALLAQKVIAGQTKGYTKHPQLIRFLNTEDPAASIGNYLLEVAVEADRRGYNFDKSKISVTTACKTIDVTRGQVQYELEHLKRKLEVRDKDRLLKLNKEKKILVNPLFQEIEGDVESWEKV
ncbi:MAG: pyrimidine dimer DNA glycosylase/endonuclease V [Spirochaetales bacterium]|nr:pyrimidine dimer DNA glycosylase/endonuclease V [Spirochaetales bacterium]